MSAGKAKEAKERLCTLINAATRANTVPTEEGIRMEDKLRTCLSNVGNVVFIDARQK